MQQFFNFFSRSWSKSLGGIQFLMLFPHCYSIDFFWFSYKMFTDVFISAVTTAVSSVINRSPKLLFTLDNTLLLCQIMNHISITPGVFILIVFCDFNKTNDNCLLNHNWYLLISKTWLKNFHLISLLSRNTNYTDQP